MFVLGLQGSPRKKGNTEFLMSAMLDEAGRRGAQTHVVYTDKGNIKPCKEYTTCEKKGFCPIGDDMKHEVYGLLRKSDIVLLASPVFFYNVTAQLKALIDRCQTLWARKYKLGLTDPGRTTRKGFVLSVGATAGKQLFDGVHLTAKYFFDAIGASYEGGLTYRNIEKAGDMEQHPTVLQDVASAAKTLFDPLAGRRKILFLCRENACRSQMAAAFAGFWGGHKIEAMSAGSNPADKINPVMTEAMQEQKIDMDFRRPQSVENVLDSGWKPDTIISMGCGDTCPSLPGVTRIEWDLPDPAGQSIGFMRDVRDTIEKNIREFIQQL